MYPAHCTKPAANPPMFTVARWQAARPAHGLGTSPIDRQKDELWQRSLSAGGIKVDFQVKMFSEMNKAAQAGQLQMATFHLTDDIANDFLRLFYRTNAGAGNPARFRKAKFDSIPTGAAYILLNGVAVL
jgi:hypothetical protein